MQGKSSKVFREELGFVGAEEIIHRNNICLLSAVQNLGADILQDGAPSLSADDEASPVKPTPPLYLGVPHQTNIPGLTNPAWQQQQQQPQQNSNAGYYQDGYMPGSLPMQNQEGSFAGSVGGSTENGQYWQQQHGNNQFQSQGQGQGPMGSGALQDSHQGNYPPSFPPAAQQAWQGSSGGKAPAGHTVKQEPAFQSNPFGFVPQRVTATGPASSGLDPSSAYPASPLPHGGHHPAQDSHNSSFPPYQPNSGLSGPGGRLPPQSSAMGMSGNASSMPYQSHQHGFPNQAALPNVSQGHGSGPAHRDSRGAPPGTPSPHHAACYVYSVCVCIDFGVAIA